MTREKSLSVIVPCFNEEGNIADTVREIEGALSGIVTDFELLIFNDCSTDHTKEAIDELAKTHPNIRAVHNPVNRGLGYNYRKGVELAAKEYVILVPGDNEIQGASIRSICQHIGQVDMVIPYIENYWVRPLGRQLLSFCFTRLANAITGFRLKYYNGIVLHRVKLLRGLEMNTDGFAYQVEILVQLLSAGATYLEVPMTLRPRSYGSSRALSPKNVASVIKTLAMMLGARVTGAWKRPVL